MDDKDEDGGQHDGQNKGHDQNGQKHIPIGGNTPEILFYDSLHGIADIHKDSSLPDAVSAK